MNIVNLADNYGVWTKSTIINLLETLGEKDFQRSDSKESLLELLQDFFVTDVLACADLKALQQLATAVDVDVKGKKKRRERLCERLMTFQNEMKAFALEQIQSLPDDSPEIKACLQVILTDPEMAEKLIEAMAAEDSESDAE